MKMRVCSHKKGALDIQFNWIFVLIVGAIILTFFGGLVYKQKTLADESAAGSVIKNLEAKFSSARSATGSAALLNLGKFEIDLKCEDYIVGKIGEPISFRALFGPDLVKGRKMVVWSFPWKIPFKVTNFLFLSSPDVRYYFLDSSDPEMIKLHNELSSRFFTVDFVDEVSQITNPLGAYKIKVVCNGCDFSAETVSIGFPEKDFSAVSFDKDAENVTFYQKSGTALIKTDSSPFLGFGKFGLPTVYAAVFSEGKEIYDCNMKKAFRNLEVVSGVYEKRTALILDGLSDYQQSCVPYYVSGDFGKIKEIAGDFTPDNVDGLLSAAVNLEKTQNFTRRSSCPWLY